MSEYKTIAIEDDSESWAAQIALEQRQQEEEREPRMDTREILERLQKAGAILDVCDARLEHLTFMINETVERIEKNDLKFRESLKKRLRI
jgi:hypothetical protein|tara:strand:+ start:297 stop:566 length:270 start_codon:yes stop_codon:yes gene_type:complete